MKWIIHGRDGYLKGHYKDPNANQPAVRGERGCWRRHYCTLTMETARDRTRRRVAGSRASGLPGFRLPLVCIRCELTLEYVQVEALRPFRPWPLELNKFSARDRRCILWLLVYATTTDRPHTLVWGSIRGHMISRSPGRAIVSNAHAFVHVHGATFNFLLARSISSIFLPTFTSRLFLSPRRSFHSPLVFTLESCFLSFF
jgi:hypothetical protein